MSRTQKPLSQCAGVCEDKGSEGASTMGWGSGSGKKEVLDPAAGELVTLGDAPGPFVDKTVLIDFSGWAHIGAKRGSKQVSSDGIEQEPCARSRWIVACAAGRI